MPTRVLILWYNVWQVEGVGGRPGCRCPGRLDKLDGGHTGNHIRVLSDTNTSSQPTLRGPAEKSSPHIHSGIVSPNCLPLQLTGNNVVLVLEVVRIRGNTGHTFAVCVNMCRTKSQRWTANHTGRHVQSVKLK